MGTERTPGRGRLGHTRDALSAVRAPNRALTSETPPRLAPRHSAWSPAPGGARPHRSGSLLGVCHACGFRTAEHLARSARPPRCPRGAPAVPCDRSGHLLLGPACRAASSSRPRHPQLLGTQEQQCLSSELITGRLGGARPWRAGSTELSCPPPPPAREDPGAAVVG